MLIILFLTANLIFAENVSIITSEVGIIVRDNASELKIIAEPNVPNYNFDMWLSDKILTFDLSYMIRVEYLNKEYCAYFLHNF